MVFNETNVDEAKELLKDFDTETLERMANPDTLIDIILDVSEKYEFFRHMIFEIGTMSFVLDVLHDVSEELERRKMAAKKDSDNKHNTVKPHSNDDIGLSGLIEALFGKIDTSDTKAGEREFVELSFGADDEDDETESDESDVISEVESIARFISKVSSMEG